MRTTMKAGLAAEERRRVIRAKRILWRMAHVRMTRKLRKYIHRVRAIAGQELARKNMGTCSSGSRCNMAMKRRGKTWKLSQRKTPENAWNRELLVHALLGLFHTWSP